jgi:TPR repeat protein
VGAASPSTIEAGTISDIVAMVAQGNKKLAMGDYAAARLWFRFAAERGSVEAARSLAATFDPNLMRGHKWVGSRPDIEEARRWYRIAAERGDAVAGERLQALDALTSGGAKP